MKRSGGVQGRETNMTRNMAQTMPANGAGGAGSGAPVVPLGQTTVLTSDDIHRIKTTLLHADAKTMGTQIKSEVHLLQEHAGTACALRMEYYNILCLIDALEMFPECVCNLLARTVKQYHLPTGDKLLTAMRVSTGGYATRDPS